MNDRRREQISFLLQRAYVCGALVVEGERFGLDSIGATQEKLNNALGNHHEAFLMASVLAMTSQEAFNHFKSKLHSITKDSKNDLPGSFELFINKIVSPHADELMGEKKI